MSGSWRPGNEFPSTLQSQSDAEAWEVSQSPSKGPTRSNMAPPPPDARYTYLIQYERRGHPDWWLTEPMGDLGEVTLAEATKAFLTRPRLRDDTRYRLMRRILPEWEIVLDGLPET